MPNAQLDRLISQLRDSGDNQSADLVAGLAEQTTLGLPPEIAFQTPSLNDFLDDARKQSSEFLLPDFQLIEEKLRLAESVAKQNRDIQIGRNKEDEQTFVKNEDRAFSSALMKAQSGFAGRGIATSGIRDRGIGDLTTDREAAKAEQMKGFERFLENENVSFDQFMKENELSGKFAFRELEKEKEAKALNIAEHNKNEQIIKNKSLWDQFEQVGATTFGDFLTQKLNA